MTEPPTIKSWGDIETQFEDWGAVELAFASWGDVVAQDAPDEEETD